MTKTSNLSPEAKSALINTRASRRGTAVPSSTTLEAVEELRAAGLVGSGGGLTDAGATARVRLVNAALDAAF